MLTFGTETEKEISHWTKMRRPRVTLFDIFLLDMEAQGGLLLMFHVHMHFAAVSVNGRASLWAHCCHLFSVQLD